MYACVGEVLLLGLPQFKLYFVKTERNDRTAHYPSFVCHEKEEVNISEDQCFFNLKSYYFQVSHDNLM